jgi:hypothetical protein
MSIIIQEITAAEVTEMCNRQAARFKEHWPIALYAARLARYARLGADTGFRPRHFTVHK